MEQVWASGVGAAAWLVIVRQTDIPAESYFSLFRNSAGPGLGRFLLCRVLTEGQEQSYANYQQYRRHE